MTDPSRDSAQHTAPEPARNAGLHPAPRATQDAATAATSNTAVGNYLRLLKGELSPLPGGVAGDIYDGITEELTGLDEATAALRMEQLGSPATIASEARAAAGTLRGDAVERPTTAGMPRAPMLTSPPAPAPTPAPTVVPITQGSGFAIAAALLVAVGGFVVPVAGWIVGIAMVWMSDKWTRIEKWMATLLPAAVVAASLLMALLLRWVNTANSGPDTDSGNPLLPALYDGAFSTLIVAMFSTVVAGIWLLWRLKRDR